VSAPTTPREHIEGLRLRHDDDCSMCSFARDIGGTTCPDAAHNALVDAALRKLDEVAALLNYKATGLLCNLTEGHDLVGEGMISPRDWSMSTIAECREMIAAVGALGVATRDGDGR